MGEFYWRAIYYDGSEADQYGPEGDAVARGYEDIDRSHLMAFEIRDRETDRLIHRVYMGGDKRLIWRRRVYKKITGEPDVVIHLVGWQRTVQGKNVQAITFVFPDGHTELIGRWHEKHPIFHSPCLREVETNN